MMKLTASPASPEDVDQLILREEDSREVSEGWRELVKGVVAEGGVLAFRDPTGALAGLFGVTQPALYTASPWLLCSDVAARHGRDLMRIARQYVRERLEPVARKGWLIFNDIPKDSHGNRRFVERLGFRIVPQDGPNDLFYLPSPCVNRLPQPWST